MFRSAACLCALGVVVACAAKSNQALAPSAGQAQAAPQPASPEPQPGLEPPAAIDKRVPGGTWAVMIGHFDLADKAKMGVIGGNVQAAQAAGRQLAESIAIPNMPDSWRPFLVDMKTAADQVARSTDLESQALAVAELGRACGNCHSELGVGPSHYLVDLPNHSWTETDDHMPRHLWDTQWMWLGVVSPSKDAFTKGAKDLTSYSLLSAEHDHAALDAAVHAIAREGLVDAGDPERRVQVMGELLATCSQCHVAQHVKLP